MARLLLIGIVALCASAAPANAADGDPLDDFYRLIARWKDEEAAERRSLVERIRVSDQAPERWHANLDKCRKRLLGDIDDLLSARTLGALVRHLAATLEPKRQAARQAITQGAYDQRRVDAAVADLREVWSAPLATQPDLLAALEARCAAVAEVDAWLALWPDGEQRPGASFEDLRRLCTERITAALMPAGSDRILAANAEAGHLDAAERQHLQVLNDYRGMLGLMPLVTDIRLHQAARRHCKDMASRGFFAHDSPVPGRHSFQDRARLYGTSASAENIANGGDDGRRVFEMWYHSEGHHRNMIAAHGAIGAGRHGRLWTQIFAGSGGYFGRKPADVLIAEQLLGLGEEPQLEVRLPLLQRAAQAKLRQTCLDQCEIVLAADPGNEIATRVRAFFGE